MRVDAWYSVELRAENVAASHSERHAREHARAGHRQRLAEHQPHQLRRRCTEGNAASPVVGSDRCELDTAPSKSHYRG